MAVGDVTGDGHADVIALTLDAPPFRLWVLRQHEGVLAPPRRLPYPLDGIGILKVADLDGDHIEEIIVGGVGGLFRISARPMLRATTSRLTSTDATNVDIADFNGDGHPDIVTADPEQGGAIHFGDGSGRFEQPAPIALPAFGVAKTAVGDLNGDGRKDYVFVTDAAYVFINQGNGSFSDPLVIQPDFENGISSVAVGDFNIDGLDDLTLAQGGNSPTIVKTYWQAEGVLAYAGAMPTYDLPESTAVADLDGDGGDDLAIVHVGWGRIGLYMSLADALPSEQLHALPFVSWGNDIHIDDVTGDGCRDVVAARGGDVVVFPGVGCQPMADLRITGTLSEHGINIGADNIGPQAPLDNVTIDMALSLSSRTGHLTVNPLPAECHFVAAAPRSAKIRCQVESIDASMGIAWFIPYSMQAAGPRARVTLSAIARTDTDERTLHNNRIWRVWSSPISAGRDLESPGKPIGHGPRSQHGTMATGHAIRR